MRVTSPSTSDEVTHTRNMVDQGAIVTDLDYRQRLLSIKTKRFSPWKDVAREWQESESHSSAEVWGRHESEEDLPWKTTNVEYPIDHSSMLHVLRTPTWIQRFLELIQPLLVADLGAIPPGSHNLADAL